MTTHVQEAFFDELAKIAADTPAKKKETHPALRMLGTLGSGLAGFATGKILSEVALEHVKPPPEYKKYVELAAPLLAAGLSAAYYKWKTNEHEELTRDFRDLQKRFERRPRQ